MRLIVILILIYVGFKIAQGFLSRKRAESPAPPEPEREETFQDPVCGVYVTEDDAVIGRHEGKRIHFCSMACLEKYRANIEHTSTADTQLKPEEHA